MFNNILNYFFLKKADYSGVEKILKNENFIYSSEDINNILKGNQKGIRYGNIILDRIENNEKHKRFFKVVLDGTTKTFKPFCRQVQLANALNEDKNITSPTMAVIKSHLKYPIPYAIFETRENGDNFGFMNDHKDFYENFTDQDMNKLVNVIYSFHKNGLDMNQNTFKYTINFSYDINKYIKILNLLLNKVITHKNNKGIIIESSVEKLLNLYLDIPDIKKRAYKIFENNWKYVISSKIKNKYYLIHADMQIDNIYKHKNGDFELLDFEWVGKSDNPIIPIMIDYGNLRARAWSSPKFQSMLDKTMLEVGKNYYKNEEYIKAGLELGILYYSLMMSRFHLDFKNTVKKDKRTEEEYQKMYPMTLKTLKEVLER